tara:strand:+ start:147 stop:368 length:222 start_codon:yes stop_codon:yes gene_type:complete
MKSLNIDIIFPWEVGLALIFLGLICIIIGVKQSKKEVDDFDKVPLIKPTTKIFFGAVFCLFGFIQLLPLIKEF